MLFRFLSKAGDEVQILTTDDKEDRPDSHLDFPITTTAGFRFILYNQASRNELLVEFLRGTHRSREELQMQR